MVVAPLAADHRFRTARDPQVFTAVLRTVPTYAAWLEVMDPITGVFPMAGLHNTLRRLVADGTPAATGLHAIGDSVRTTNPTLGRGLALALSSAADLADAIGEHAADPAAQALALDRLVGAHVVPFYHDQAGIDAARLAMMRHTIFRAPPPRPSQTPARSPIPSCARLRPGIHRLPRVLEDQRDDLPARRGLHRPGCRSAHAGNSQAAAPRRRSPSRPGNSSSPPWPGRGLHAGSLTQPQPQPHGNGATFPATA